MLQDFPGPWAIKFFKNFLKVITFAPRIFLFSNHLTIQEVPVLHMESFPLSESIRILAPATAKALISEIWTEQRYLRHVDIDKDSIVLDIGANVGIFSLLAASKGAKVYSFEPNPETYALLNQNIISNGFAGRIIPFNLAVSAESGRLELAIPDSGKIYALGSATTTLATRLQLESDQGIKSRLVEVSCISMRALLDEIIGSTAVHFLKIDCEGAEWEILESLDAAYASRINHFAMETHLGYREKDIAHLINSLGFAIKEVRPRLGVFQTGYIYGSRSELVSEKSALGRPIAILESPSHVFAGEAILFDGGDSFSPGVGDESLTYRWEIDGILSGSLPRLTTNFPAPGVRRIVLTVGDGSSETATVKDLLVLEQAYSEPGWECLSLPPGRKEILQLQGTRRLRISDKDLPADWEIAGIVLAISILHPSASTGTNLRCHFNGTVVDIDSVYLEIPFRMPTKAAGCNFTLSATGTETVPLEISWWPFSSEDSTQGQQNGDTGAGDGGDGGDGILPGLGVSKHVVFQGTKTFSIQRDALPVEWVPKALKIGISSLPHPGSTREAPGYLEILERRHVLEGYYSEVTVADYNPNRDNEFAINVPEERKLKIVWWGE